MNTFIGLCDLYDLCTILLSTIYSLLLEIRYILHSSQVSENVRVLCSGAFPNIPVQFRFDAQSYVVAQLSGQVIEWLRGPALNAHNRLQGVVYILHGV